MPITSRSPLRQAQDSALARGDHTFTIAIACPHGHLGQRYASNGNCVQCASLFRGYAKPKEERQLKLKNANGKVTQVAQDADTITLIAYAKRELRDLMGQPVSKSLIHKAGIVLLADYLRNNPTAQTFRSLIR